MGHLELTHVSHTLPDGRVLLDDVSLRVGNGSKSALVGANGVGKTTLLGLVAGEVAPQAGTVTRSGEIGLMHQFVGRVRDDSTVRDLLLSVAPSDVRRAGARLASAEAEMGRRADERSQMAYATTLSDWGDAGGYEIEVLWDVCSTAALGLPFHRAGGRPVRSLSGGEQKRLVLEALLRGRQEVLVLDEPDNSLDVPAKGWLEERLAETVKTVLFVSHDRELLARVAGRIITVEAGTCWVHGGGFAGYAQARARRLDRLEEMRRRWDEEHERLVAWVRRLGQQARISDALTSRYRAAQTRLRRFEEVGPPAAPPVTQTVTMRLAGGRTGVRAVRCTRLELTGLMAPFDAEIFFGDRVAVVGSNGSGKSHFLRLLAQGGTDAPAAAPGASPVGEAPGGATGEAVDHLGHCRLGARVVPGFSAQSHSHPQLVGQSPFEVLRARFPLDHGGAVAALRRYELDGQAHQPCETLSGGQQARLQILLLELSGATLLLLDEPTDNLDLVSAEALQEALARFEGTVVAVTHDRWFARSFDRFLVFGEDGRVVEHDAPVWDHARAPGRD